VDGCRNPQLICGLTHRTLPFCPPEDVSLSPVLPSAVDGVLQFRGRHQSVMSSTIDAIGHRVSRPPIDRSSSHSTHRPAL
jgi:hypothetical protein